MGLRTEKVRRSRPRGLFWRAVLLVRDPPHVSRGLLGPLAIKHHDRAATAGAATKSAPDSIAAAEPPARPSSENSSGRGRSQSALARVVGVAGRGAARFFERGVRLCLRTGEVRRRRPRGLFWREVVLVRDPYHVSRGLLGPLAIKHHDRAATAGAATKSAPDSIAAAEPPARPSSENSSGRGRSQSALARVVGVAGRGAARFFERGVRWA